ncbi:unnamed protein product [Arabis nemorensis]|uniref:BHLH domain-containing protein n=1 Tax=Arabis nemorensis TaxID=586526 RepID=A0A565C071_9BRAS|nr:unnamed protein product [Arabis nemorensis]
MEMERNLSIVSARNYDTGNHRFGASSSKMKVEDEETGLSLSQWLNPSKVPLSYLALLNEESTTPDEKAQIDYVVKKVVLPNRGDAAATGPGGGGRGIRTLYSASDKIGSSKVKPSIRVQSRTNNDETCGSSSKVPVGKRSSRNKSQHLSSSQVYSEKLRSWKDRSNNNNNRDFSQLYGKYRHVPSKQSNKNKNRPYATENERKQKIEENIKALGELLAHETKDSPELILNDVIAHVKLLQLQMKELSRSRLGGESISHPMISIEGFGHYIHHEQMKIKPLEEIMGDLLANDFEGAANLLETKGLYLMPLSSDQGFP